MVVVVVTVVIVGLGVGDGDGVWVAPGVVVVGSLHPNQPGVLHVAVVDVLIGVVVVSSRQPHHPGVLHVSVLVLEYVLVLVLLSLVVVSVPLLSKNFQL